MRRNIQSITAPYNINEKNHIDTHKQPVKIGKIFTWLLNNLSRFLLLINFKKSKKLSQSF